MNLVGGFVKSEVEHLVGDPGTWWTADTYCFESKQFLEMLARTGEFERSRR